VQSVTQGQKTGIITLEKQYSTNSERYLEHLSDSKHASYLDLDVPTVSMGAIEELATAPWALDSLMGLIPGQGIALVRIRGMDQYPRLARGILPFNSTRKSWMPSLGGTGSEPSSRTDLSPISSISSDLPSRIFLDISNQKVSIPRLLPESQIESTGAMSLFPMSVQHHVLDIPGFVADGIAIFGNRAEIPAADVLFERTDLEAKHSATASQEDLELEQLRTIRLRVHTIMNEELRKYGFET
jgi:hypothetical protein